MDISSSLLHLDGFTSFESSWQEEEEAEETETAMSGFIASSSPSSSKWKSKSPPAYATTKDALSWFRQRQEQWKSIPRPALQSLEDVKAVVKKETVNNEQQELLVQPARCHVSKNTANSRNNSVVIKARMVMNNNEKEESLDVPPRIIRVRRPRRRQKPPPKPETTTAVVRSNASTPIVVNTTESKSTDDGKDCGIVEETTTTALAATTEPNQSQSVITAPSMAMAPSLAMFFDAAEEEGESDAKVPAYPLAPRSMPSRATSNKKPAFSFAPKSTTAVSSQSSSSAFSFGAVASSFNFGGSTPGSMRNPFSSTIKKEDSTPERSANAVDSSSLVVSHQK